MHPPSHYRHTLSFLLVGTLLHGAAMADATRLPMVPVTASPLHESSTLNAAELSIDAIQSRRSATSDTASLLRGVPGLSIYTAGGVSGLPTIRGMADDRLRIKVDGMDLISACGNHMNPPLSYIDPTNVGSIQVMAGITPVSMGGDSIGGSIVVESSAPQFAEAGEGLLHTGELGVFYRSNGHAQGGNLAATLATETVSLSYSGSTARADNYHAAKYFKPAGPAAAGRGDLDADEVGSTHYQSTNQQLALALRHDQHLTELKVGMQDIPYQAWPNQRMDMTGNDSTHANLRYQGAFEWGSLDARAYQERTRHYMQFGDDKLYWYGANNGSIPDGEPCEPAPGMNGCAAGMPMDTKGDNSGVVLKADVVLNERDRLLVGTEGQRYRMDDWWDPSGKGMSPEVFWNINNGQRDRLGLFAEWEANWNTQWQSQLGLRHETVTMNADEVQGYNASFSPADSEAFNTAARKHTDHNLDLTALARFSPEAGRSIEVGFAQKTRSPNLYERYAWSTHGMAMRMINMVGDGNGYVGNIDLKPEVANTLSASFDWRDVAGQQWGLQISPYYTYVSDYIDAERCDTGGNACTAENLTRDDGFVYLRYLNESASIYGIDLSGHFPLATDHHYGDFTLHGSMSYTRGKNETTGDNLYNIMPLNATLALSQRKGRWSNTAELELVDGKKKVSETRNEMPTSGYGLLHLRSSYEWKQVRLDVGIENLLDRFYHHPQGGAYTGQGKTMSGTDVDWGVPVPGMGRSLYAGVNLKF